MLTDQREIIRELREEYREAWLDEATPLRLQSALYRWDAEWDYWTAMLPTLAFSLRPLPVAVPASGVHPAQGEVR